MLSTPPAFILSQDQTLMFNVDPSSRSTSFFILVITVLIKNVRWFLLKSSEKFIRIFKVVLLFSCQRSFCDLLRIRSFIIISLRSWLVKNFFDLFCWPVLHKNRSNFYIVSCSFSFVKNFLILFLKHYFKSLWNNMFLSVSHRQLKYNIMRFLLCQHFFSFFSFFI